jgi:hypothetical protein
MCMKGDAHVSCTVSTVAGHCHHWMNGLRILYTTLNWIPPSTRFTSHKMNNKLNGTESCSFSNM